MALGSSCPEIGGNEVFLIKAHNIQTCVLLYPEQVFKNHPNWCLKFIYVDKKGGIIHVHA
jgi:hypothetical protein